MTESTPTTKPEPSSDHPPQKPPPVDPFGHAFPRGIIWAGYVCAVIALLFFIGLTFIPISCGQRFPAIVVLALATALASAFIGGSASASGQLPLPKGMSPVKFAVTGGIAVLIILLILGHTLWVQGCPGADDGKITERVISIPD